MKRRYRSSKSALFLMELIISITFFALSSAICMQLFAKAHLLSVQSRDLNGAMNAAQSTAEIFKAERRSYGAADALSDNAETEILYDAGWQLVEAGGEGRYLVRIACEPQRDGLLRADISVHRIGEAEALYTLETYSYVPSDR